MFWIAGVQHDYITQVWKHQKPFYNSDIFEETDKSDKRKT